MLQLVGMLAQAKKGNPKIMDVASTASAGATVHTVNLPTGIAVDDLLLMIVAPGNAGVTLTDSDLGWTFLYSFVADGSETVFVYARTATGIEGATTSITLSASALLTAIVYRIENASNQLTTDYYAFNSVNDGNVLNPNPPALTPSWGNDYNLWLALAASRDGSTTLSAYPANYTKGQIAVPNSSAAGSGLFCAGRELKAISDDPGAFTMTVARGFASATIAIHRAEPGAPVNTAVPTITGTPNVLSVLTCNKGSWVGYPTPTFAYQWLRNDAPISGATNSTYTLVQDDLNATIKCAVTASNSLGDTSATSAATATISPPVPVFVGGQSGGSGFSSSDTIDAIALTGGISSTLREGDIIILSVVVASNTDFNFDYMTLDTPGRGYTRLGETYSNDTNDCNHFIGYKVVGAVPPTTINVGTSGNSAHGIAYTMQVWRNIDTDTPFDVTSTITNGIDTGIPPAGSITPANDNTVVVFIAAGAGTAGNVQYANASLSNLKTYAAAATTYDAYSGMGNKPGSKGVAVASGTWSGGAGTGTANSWGSARIVLRPLGVPPSFDIIFVGANTSASQVASLTPPAHQVGDLIAAVLISTTTVKTLPAPWVLCGTSPGAGSYRHAVYYKIAESTSEVITPQGSGTLQFIGSFVYRNATAVGTPAFDVASTFTYPALTLEPGGKSWVASFAWDIFGGVANEYPIGSTFRAQNPDANKYLALFDTDKSVSSWPATNPNTQPNAGVGQAVGCFEIIGVTPPKKIEYISINNGGSITSLALPTHQPGDLIVMLCDGTSAPTVPSGWTEWSRLSTYTNKSVIAYKVAASASEVSGTWANAYALSALVYRNATPGAEATAGASGTGTTNWPALTLQDSSGTSVVLHFGAAQATTAGPTLAAGDTNRPGPTSNYHKTSDTNDGVTSMPTKPNSVQGISLHTLELKLVP